MKSSFLVKSLLVGFILCTANMVVLADEVTYYFNSIGGSWWNNGSANMNKAADGNLGTSASSNIEWNYFDLNGNTCNGNDLGEITSVELRVYCENNYDINPFKDVCPLLTPIYGGTSFGTNSWNTIYPGDYNIPQWTTYFDVTNGSNSPGTWTWDNVRDLDCRVQVRRPNGGMLKVYKVEIRVTYTPSCTAPDKPLKPSAISNTCGVTDLYYTGNVPAGEEWYWQTSATGTSTAHSANPYTVNSSGTYYLRALNLAENCWSLAASSITVNVPQEPQEPTVNDTSICSGDVLLKAYGSDACVEYKWYDSSTGGNLIHTGETYNVNLTTNTSYYIEAALPATFAVTPFSTNSYTVEHFAESGDDRSGIAITPNYLFVVGDNNTVRFNLPLSSGVRTQLPVRDGLFSDLSNGNLWSLYNGSTMPNDANLSGYTVNSLLKLDNNLNSTGTVQNLSQSFIVSNEGGIYAGVGFVIIQDGSTNSFYHIDLSTGQVSNLGTVNTPTRSHGENWATWGVAEFDACNYSVLYTSESSNNITRLNLSTGVESVAANFSDIGNMTSITASPWDGRWYFHHENTSQWTGVNGQIAGFCDASIDQTSSSCSSDRQRVNVSVTTAPLKPDISAFPAIISSGDNSTLAAGYSGGTLTWYDDNCGGHDFATGASVEVSPPITTTYYAHVINGSCISDCDTVVVTVSHPCHVDAMANGVYGTLNICAGDVVDIAATGACDYLMDNSFDDGVMGIGWESNANPQFNNPCMESFDGTTYLWIGDAATFPRDLITQPYSVTHECQICFDFVMATQGHSTPCEGPDEMDEGVSLQWSTDDGASWTDITYFCPDGNQYPTNSWVGSWANGGGSGTPFNVWDNYCFNVPAEATSDATKFRFHQEQVTNYVFDHWGLDNVEITCPTPGQVVQWSYGPTELDPVDDITPGSSGTYTVILDDGLNFGNSDTSEVKVNIIGTPTVVDDQACAPGDNVTLEASGTGVLSWYDAPTGGNLVHTGSVYNISNILSPLTLYVAESMPFFSDINYTFNSGMEGWTSSRCLGSNDWTLSYGALYANNPASSSSKMVQSPVIDVSTWNSSLTFSYTHAYETQMGYDGGVVAYRLDGGTWQVFTPSTGSYNGNVYMINNPINNCTSNNLACYNGSNWYYVTHSGPINVSGANTLELAFAFTTNSWGSSNGWLIDNVSLVGGGVSTCPAARAEVHANISQLHAGSNSVDVSCFGNNDGQVTATPVDGLGIPLGGIYNYNWDSGESTSTVTGLAAGSYPVTISDSYNCEATTTVTVGGPSMPNMLVSSTGVSGDCNIVSPDEWVHIVNGANDDELIASVFDAAGGNDLYLTEAEVTIFNTVQFRNEQAYLPRVVRITPGVQGEAVVRIYFTNAEFSALQAVDPSISSINDLAVTKCDEGAGFNNCVLVNGTSFSISPVGSGYYAEVPVTSFSKFYIHKNTGWALPVELTSFEASCTSEYIDINWSTSSETNNHYFVLEKSYDLKTFEFVATVDGAGNANSIKKYEYKDYTSVGEDLYYRLSQVDFDGTVEIHNIITANCFSQQEELFIAYQSGENKIVIEAQVPKGVYTLKLIDNTGSEVLTKEYYLTEEKIKLEIDRQALVSGIYYVSLRSNRRVKHAKVSIK
jgi:hypothetical protein